MKPALCFLLAIFTGLGFTSCNWRRSIEVSVVELPLPNDLPNLRNPFWLNHDKIGFVTGTLDRSRTLDGALFSYDIHTKHLEKLLDRSVWDARFLPKQHRIAFLHTGNDQGLTLFTASLSGEEIKEVFERRGFLVFDPSWSPDERKLVYADSSYDSDLFVVDTETGEGEVVNTGRAVETSGTEDPDWSPDGTDIVYTGWDKSSRIKDDGYVPEISRLYRYDLRTKTYRRLTEGSFQDRHPAYSPDGKYIVFVSNRSGNGELWTMNHDGTGLRKITDMASRRLQVTPEKPAWSPDQTKILFSAAPVKALPRIDDFPFEGARIWSVEFVKGK